jgi:tRNA(fMet)-specific endonuclease VapC
LSVALPQLYLLDTNIISHLMREPVGAVQQALQRRATAPGGCTMATSVIVRCELLYGVVRKGSAKLQAAYEVQMRHLLVQPLEASVGPHYAHLRAGLDRMGKALSANDLLIAAHALSLDAILVSADAAFTQVPGLRLENWLLE